MAIIRIISGSISPFIDSLGRTWGADNSFTGGTSYLSSTPITNTNDDLIFRSQRFGNFTYSIPISNGNYNLQLGLAETYWPNPGFRTFNVSAQGNTILSAYDPFARAGGKNIAKIESFPIVVSSGLVNLIFTTIIDNAMISNIEIVPSATNYRASPSMLLGA